MPATLFDVGREVIDDSEEQRQKDRSKNPTQNSGRGRHDDSKKMMVDAQVSQSGEEVAAKQRGQHERDQHHKNDSNANGREPRGKIGARLLDLVNDVEAVLNGGRAYRGGPDRGDQAEGEFAAGGGRGRLIERFENRTQSGVRNDDREVTQKRIVNV